MYKIVLRNALYKVFITTANTIQEAHEKITRIKLFTDYIYLASVINTKTGNRVF